MLARIAIGCLSILTGTALGVAQTPAHAGVFTSSEQCAVCHSGAPGAHAMRSATGEDVSPYGLWQGTMMANSFRDPYFRAQLQKETAAAGEAVQELCLRCHTPMVHHGAVMDGDKPPRLTDADGDLFADDGVSCTVCHTMLPEGFGEEASFSGQPKFNRERAIFGPYQDVFAMPMRNMVRYTPQQGLHVRKAALCATCHTLITEHGDPEHGDPEHHGTPFPEQTPYLEWRNSDFNDESGPSDETRTCQQCHMPKTGATRIARNPMGLDFFTEVRGDYAGHLFVGGNAFMIDLLRRYRAVLGVNAEADALLRTAEATRRQLAETTARVEISTITREEGVAKFTVRVENLTGHKFPTGYPSRRAWLHVRVDQGGHTVFESGEPDTRGRLRGVADELRLPHQQLVEKPEQAVVYELVADDPEGNPTTFLTKMTKKRKDNRILPRGFKSAGADPRVAPVGTDGDDDFVGGSDTVHFRVPIEAGRRGRVIVRVTMYYQTVPPAWVDALRTVEADDAKRFVSWYDDADKLPETIAVAARGEG